MKTKIITSLKSRVLLVQQTELEETFIGYPSPNSMEFLTKRGKSIYIEIPEDSNWNLLGKLKDLTDKDCEGLVESKEYTSYDADGLVYDTCYKNYQMNEEAFKLGYLVHTTPKESFLSALEAEELHLNGNPYKQQFDKYFHIKHFKKAEQNVFSPETLIFVEQ